MQVGEGEKGKLEVVRRATRIDAILLERCREVLHGEDGALTSLKEGASGKRRRRLEAAQNAVMGKEREEATESRTHLLLILPNATCSTSSAAALCSSTSSSTRPCILSTPSSRSSGCSRAGVLERVGGDGGDEALSGEG
jgi:hypothetical protein